jgi:hypothetical protein
LGLIVELQTVEKLAAELPPEERQAGHAATLCFSAHRGRPTDGELVG